MPVTRSPPPATRRVVARSSSSDAITRRELYFFDLYRVFEATLLTGLCFSPWAVLVGEISAISARTVALTYLIGAVALFVSGRMTRRAMQTRIVGGLAMDIMVATAAIAATVGFDSGVAALALVNVACGALLLPLRLALVMATLAALGVTAAIGFTDVTLGTAGSWTEAALFAVSYLGGAALCQILRRDVTETQLRADRQETDLASLTQLNDLIIRRMRTGVIVVDGANQIQQVNEAAWHLLGNPPAAKRDLGEVAAEISRRLYHWRTHGKTDTVPVALAAGMPEVIPRFVRLGADEGEDVVIFLDDISLLSRQAEQLTLSSLGRLAASVAHEVRNPLAAISYSAQLLGEATEIPEADQRLVDIIRSQCTRMNAIVENILQLSRRERSKPEPMDLVPWVLGFVEEYRSTNAMERDELRAVTATRSVSALVDPNQLHQVVWNMVQNARRYGRLPDQPARIAIVARHLAEQGPPVVEVVDRGPGIPKRVADQIFDPFFTTHEHGTGLGLYIARQLCEANQGALDYVPVAGGGSCFRITLAPPQSSSSTSTARAAARSTDRA